jgi:secreted PhoX family phosphatase
VDVRGFSAAAVELNMRTKHSFLRSLFLLAIVPTLACGDDGGGNADGGTGSTGADGSTTNLNPTPGVVDDDSGDSGPSTTSTTGTDPDTGDGDSSGTTGDPPVEATIPSLVKELVALENAGTDVEGFPLEYIPASPSLTTIPQLEPAVMTAFLDPLRDDDAATVWGANNDFIAYLGDGWADDVGSPYFSGSGDAGWMWTNFEYISNARAEEGVAPTGVALQMVTWLHDSGVAEFQFDVADAAEWTAPRVDAFILWHKRMLGGALYRVQRDGGGWSIDTTADNVRFDGTSDTLLRITGPIDVGVAQDDAGVDLPPNVVPGTSSNCSGGVTPWGTIVTAEENTQFAYGNLEACWTSSNAFVPGTVCAPGSNIVWDTSPNASSDFTRGSAVNTRPDYYGYLVEIDPESDPGLAYDPATGDGHQKLGALGRARWENSTFHVGPDWNLVADQSIVIYGGDDTRGGRIYKWVSRDPYTAGMTKAQIRNLLADGDLYVAHFADLDNSDDDLGAQGGITVGGSLPTAAAPGQGQWILMSTDNDAQIAPNAGGGAGGMTSVGDALRSTTWNGMGGFPDDPTMLLGLYTASNKVGIRELNRPEDVEYNPVDGTLWVAFTNHNRPNALRDDGTLNLDDPGTPANERDAYVRSDGVGAIFVMTETDAADPGASTSFTFRTAWHGTTGAGVHDAANPDNIAIDHDGGVWFGTDGNFSDETQDAIYYLEVADDAADSRAWRVASVPSDAEATGPAFAADERSFFFNVQHPQEELSGAPVSDFAVFGDLGPRSGQVVLTLAPR